jgi:DNA-binding NarL/FixJ family response regulator
MSTEHGERLLERTIVTIVLGRLEPIVGAGLELLLEREPCVHLFATDVDHAGLEDAVTQQQPRVVIVGESSEYDLLLALKATKSVRGVLVIAEAPSVLCGTFLLASGVGCLASSATVADLLAAIRFAAAGQPVFLRAGADGAVRRRLGEGLLTPRESEVFEQFRRGTTSYRRVGRALHIAPETVRSHVVSICRKLKVADKQELIGMSLQFEELAGCSN